jgi:hypothetical protein
MRFPYKRYGPVLRPVVSVTICDPDTSKEFICQALVDSGAEISVFGYEVAEALGIDTTQKKDREYFGIGGLQVECVTHAVHFQLGGWSHKANARFMLKKDDRKLPYGILGQNGFFQYFKITFDRFKEEFEIQK